MPWAISTLLPEAFPLAENHTNPAKLGALVLIQGAQMA
jgi:hypothetical protein